MATEALRSQVGKKWQDAFARLNHGEPGISGLMTFSQVSVGAYCQIILLTCIGTGMGSFDRLCASKGPQCPSSSQRIQCVRLSCAAFMFKYVQVDMELVKHAFDLVSQCRRLPVMLEAFLGTISSSVALSEY